MIDARMARDPDTGIWDADLAVGDFVTVDSGEDGFPDVVRNRLIFRLHTFLGESPFDRSSGFPWEQGVFGKSSLEGIGNLLRSYILETEGVDGLDGDLELAVDDGSVLIRGVVLVGQWRLNLDDLGVTIGGQDAG